MVDGRAGGLGVVEHVEAVLTVGYGDHVDRDLVAFGRCAERLHGLGDVRRLDGTASRFGIDFTAHRRRGGRLAVEGRL